uniref:C-type lectin domain-containing protein n=1 Tax=Varanus komodoensis TaxID=61221 RepID=A0A8D2L9X0_VARKO
FHLISLPALSAPFTDGDCSLPGIACPSLAWILFERSCYALLPGPLETRSIEDAREYCRGNGADIISINNKEENTFIKNSFCSHWHGPEYISLGMFFDTDGETAWTTALVITSTVIVSVAAAILWFLYQRRVSSGARDTIHRSTNQSPYNDETMLIEEGNEYTA